VFTPVLAKHSKSFSLIDCISVGGTEHNLSLATLSVEDSAKAWAKRAKRGRAPKRDKESPSMRTFAPLFLE